MPDLLDEAVAGRLVAPQSAEPVGVSEVRRRGHADGVPTAHPDSAALLRGLAQATRARRVFEIGTGYGLSTLAVALETGHDSLVFSVERDPTRAAVARGFFNDAGVGGRVNVMLGEAARLVHKVAGPFDLIVLDGDDGGREPLLDRLIALLRPDGVLVSIGATSADERLVHDARLRTALLPVGDGMAISVKVGDQS